MVPIALWLLGLISGPLRSSASRSQLAAGLSKQQGCRVYFVLVDDHAAKDLMSKLDFVKLWIQMNFDFGHDGFSVTKVVRTTREYDKVKYEVTISKTCETPPPTLVGTPLWSNLRHSLFAKTNKIPQNMLDMADTVTLVATSGQDMPMADFNPDQTTTIYAYDETGSLFKKKTMKAVLEKMFNCTAKNVRVQNLGHVHNRVDVKYVVTWEPFPFMSRVELETIVNDSMYNFIRSPSIITRADWIDFVQVDLNLPETTITSANMRAPSEPQGCEIYFILVDNDAATELMMDNFDLVKIWIEMNMDIGLSGWDIKRTERIANGYDKVKYKVTISQICETPLRTLVGQHWWSDLRKSSWAEDDHRFSTDMLDLADKVTLVATSGTDLSLSQFNPEQIVTIYVYDDNCALLQDINMKAILKQMFGSTAEYAYIKNHGKIHGRVDLKYVVTWKPNPFLSTVPPKLCA